MAIFNEIYLEEKLSDLFKKKKPVTPTVKKDKYTDEEVDKIFSDTHKVISICKSVYKNLKEKYKKDFDYTIDFSIDEYVLDDYKLWKEDKDQDFKFSDTYITIASGGIYPSNSKSENRNNIDKDKYDIRMRIFVELMKEVNKSIKENSINGKITDDWCKYDFSIDYELS